MDIKKIDLNSVKSQLIPHPILTDMTVTRVDKGVIQASPKSIEDLGAPLNNSPNSQAVNVSFRVALLDLLEGDLLDIEQFKDLLTINAYVITDPEMIEELKLAPSLHGLTPAGGSFEFEGEGVPGFKLAPTFGGTLTQLATEKANWHKVSGKGPKVWSTEIKKENYLEEFRKKALKKMSKGFSNYETTSKMQGKDVISVNPGFKLQPIVTTGLDSYQKYFMEYKFDELEFLHASHGDLSDDAAGWFYNPLEAMCILEVTIDVDGALGDFGIASNDFNISRVCFYDIFKNGNPVLQYDAVLTTGLKYWIGESTRVITDKPDWENEKKNLQSWEMLWGPDGIGADGYRLAINQLPQVKYVKYGGSAENINDVLLYQRVDRTSQVKDIRNVSLGTIDLNVSLVEDFLQKELSPSPFKELMPAGWIESEVGLDGSPFSQFYSYVNADYNIVNGVVFDTEKFKKNSFIYKGFNPGMTITALSIYRKQQTNADITYDKTIPEELLGTINWQDLTSPGLPPAGDPPGGAGLGDSVEPDKVDSSNTDLITANKVMLNDSNMEYIAFVDKTAALGREYKYRLEISYISTQLEDLKKFVMKYESIWSTKMQSLVAASILPQYYDKSINRMRSQFFTDFWKDAEEVKKFTNDFIFYLRFVFAVPKSKGGGYNTSDLLEGLKKIGLQAGNSLDLENTDPNYLSFTNDMLEALLNSVRKLVKLPQYLFKAVNVSSKTASISVGIKSYDIKNIIKFDNVPHLQFFPEESVAKPQDPFGALPYKSSPMLMMTPADLKEFSDFEMEKYFSSQNVEVSLFQQGKFFAKDAEAAAKLNINNAGLYFTPYSLKLGVKEPRVNCLNGNNKLTFKNYDSLSEFFQKASSKLFRGSETLDATNLEQELFESFIDITDVQVVTQKDVLMLSDKDKKLFTGKQQKVNKKALQSYLQGQQTQEAAVQDFSFYSFFWGLYALFPFHYLFSLNANVFNATANDFIVNSFHPSIQGLVMDWLNKLPPFYKSILLKSVDSANSVSGTDFEFKENRFGMTRDAVPTYLLAVQNTRRVEVWDYKDGQWKPLSLGEITKRIGSENFLARFAPSSNGTLSVASFTNLGFDVEDEFFLIVSEKYQKTGVIDLPSVSVGFEVIINGKKVSLYGNLPEIFAVEAPLPEKLKKEEFKSEVGKAPHGAVKCKTNADCKPGEFCMGVHGGNYCKKPYMG
tara:strand:+ start:1143 stop:4742 length:3600 start_codon:yes stop_codon:yes gene_type:complete